MAKLKHLKSIAHNLAHTYFSLMNYIDGDYILEHLFKIVKENQISEFKVDVINVKIEPEIFILTKYLK